VPTILKHIERFTHTLIIALLFLPILYGHVGFASSAYRPTKTGFDISYPQCQKEYPEYTAFSVIGVNGGRPFTENPCFHDQVVWSKSHLAKTSVYMNLSYIAPRSAQYALLGPNICLPLDESCFAYNYGYQAAVYAEEQATENNFTPYMWWLDIETMNTWSKDKELNKQVIKGAIDALQENSYRVGVYSTAYQWNVIAGDFKPELPVWSAGASSKNTAPDRCNSKYAFTGGYVMMVQYIANNFDNNHLCQ
jgi:hypothetical protein